MFEFMLVNASEASVVDRCCAFYLRISTPDQKSDLRYDGLRDYAERAGLVVAGEYADVAVSDRREGRPQLNALMASARNCESITP